jgi:hypothetical protein
MGVARVVPMLPPEKADKVLPIGLVEGSGIDKGWRPLDEISPHLIRATVAGEDARFPPRLRLGRSRHSLGSIPERSWPFAWRQHHLDADREECLPVARPGLAAQRIRSLVHGADRACMLSLATRRYRLVSLLTAFT